MSARGESLMEVLRRSFASASRVNPDSPNRRTIRQLLRWNELEVAEALLCLDTIAHMDDRCDLEAFRQVVRDARSVLVPMWERRPA